MHQEIMNFLISEALKEVKRQQDMTLTIENDCFKVLKTNDIKELK